MTDIKKYLKGGDLRSIAGVEQLIPLIKTQKDFDELFSCLYSEDRLIDMRAPDDNDFGNHDRVGISGDYLLPGIRLERMECRTLHIS